MRVVRFILLCVLIAAFLFPSAAQQPPSPATLPQRDPQALALLSQSLMAMGPLASPNRMTIAQGTITYPNGDQKPITMKTSGTNRLRHDVGSGEFTFISTSLGGFLILKGAKHNLQFWVTQYKRPEHLPALSLMSDYENPLLQVKYLGLEPVNGSLAHHIRLSMLPADNTPPEIEDLLSEFHVYIDQASLLVVRTRSFNFSPEAIQNRSPVDTFYSDYRTQDGAQVPWHLVRYVDTQKDSEIAFTSISLNAAVPDSDFQ
jgi:hypothetical protein